MKIFINQYKRIFMMGILSHWGEGANIIIGGKNVEEIQEEKKEKTEFMESYILGKIGRELSFLEENKLDKIKQELINMSKNSINTNNKVILYSKLKQVLEDNGYTISIDEKFNLGKIKKIEETFFINQISSTKIIEDNKTKIKGFKARIDDIKKEISLINSKDGISEGEEKEIKINNIQTQIDLLITQNEEQIKQKETVQNQLKQLKKQLKDQNEEDHFENIVNRVKDLDKNISKEEIIKQNKQIEKDGFLKIIEIFEKYNLVGKLDDIRDTTTNEKYFSIKKELIPDGEVGIIIEKVQKAGYKMTKNDFGGFDIKKTTIQKLIKKEIPKIKEKSQDLEESKVYKVGKNGIAVPEQIKYEEVKVTEEILNEDENKIIEKGAKYISETYKDGNKIEKLYILFFGTIKNKSVIELAKATLEFQKTIDNLDNDGILGPNTIFEKSGIPKKDFFGNNIEQIRNEYKFNKEKQIDSKKIKKEIKEEIKEEVVVLEGDNTQKKKLIPTQKKQETIIPEKKSETSISEKVPETIKKIEKEIKEVKETGNLSNTDFTKKDVENLQNTIERSESSDSMISKLLKALESFLAMFSGKKFDANYSDKKGLKVENFSPEAEKLFNAKDTKYNEIFQTIFQKSGYEKGKIVLADKKKLGENNIPFALELDTDGQNMFIKPLKGEKYSDNNAKVEIFWRDDGNLIREDVELKDLKKRIKIYDENHNFVDNINRNKRISGKINIEEFKEVKEGLLKENEMKGYLKGVENGLIIKAVKENNEIKFQISGSGEFVSKAEMLKKVDEMNKNPKIFWETYLTTLGIHLERNESPGLEKIIINLPGNKDLVYIDNGTNKTIYEYKNGKIVEGKTLGVKGISVEGLFSEQIVALALGIKNNLDLKSVSNFGTGAEIQEIFKGNNNLKNTQLLDPKKLDNPNKAITILGKPYDDSDVISQTNNKYKKIEKQNTNIDFSDEDNGWGAEN